MTLDKAIEIVGMWYKGGYATRIEDMTPALKLLIEAGKREQILRHEIPYDRDGLLPGETKD